MSVHSGFLGAYYSVKPRLRELLDRLIDSPGWTVLVTGHSLGGALATLCSFELANRIYVDGHAPAAVRCYTFGSPRVGNGVFAGRFRESVPDNWRVHNRDDLIPMVPRLLGYTHVENGVALDDDGKLEINGAQELVIGEGAEADKVINSISGELLRQVQGG